MFWNSPRLLTRAALSQMDVPALISYAMVVVGLAERTAVASVTVGTPQPGILA